MGLRRPAQEAPTPWQQLIRPNGHGPADATPLLSLQGVSAGYGRRAVIHDVSMDLYPGELVALVGDNGAGKSTLALAACGLLKPLEGRVQFLGGKRPRPGLDVALLFQDPGEQLFTDSVDEEVAYGPRNYGCYDEEKHRETLLEADLAGLRQRRPLSLSVGQQQRTALAASLALRPRLLILDEPTLGQDWQHLSRLMDFLTLLSCTGSAILLISHDYKLVHHYARRAILMEKGRVKAMGHLAQHGNHRRVAGCETIAQH